jgi:hypothetical protein
MSARRLDVGREHLWLDLTVTRHHPANSREHQTDQHHGKQCHCTSGDETPDDDTVAPRESGVGWGRGCGESPCQILGELFGTGIPTGSVGQ